MDAARTVRVRPRAGVVLREHEFSRLRHANVPLLSEAVIEEVRALGYASQHDEYIPGMSSVAVPIPSTKLGLVALAITAPSSRYDEEAALQALKSGAKEIASLVGETA
jgi:DNA-binding IclR family transcriptional regulator